MQLGIISKPNKTYLGPYNEAQLICDLIIK